jgi:hypothetical protein
MLRAVLWRRSRRKLAATRTAALWGQILAGVLIAASLAAMRWWSLWSGLWTLLLASFLLLAARSEWRASAPRPELLSCAVSELGRALPAPLSPSAPVSLLERTLAEHPGAPLVPVYDDHGHVASLALPDSLARVPPAQRPLVPVSSIVEPLWSLPRVHPDESVEQVLGRLGHGANWRAVVTDGTGIGAVLCSEDVERVVELATP